MSDHIKFFIIIICLSELSIFFSSVIYPHDNKFLSIFLIRAENINDEMNDDPDDEHSIPHIDQLFKNPAVISGLQSTTNAINQSIQSLMETIFYSLMDSQLKHPVTPELFYGINSQRNVYNSQKGSYIIVDRVYTGPESRKKIGQIGAIPIWLGSFIHSDVINIYMRTDAQRLAEKTILPSWRYWLNNWFGGLPFLEAILPPSFNPNELYDPMAIPETAFMFPTEKKDFDQMPENSIRSYGISGGISLPLDLTSLSSSHKKFFQKFDLQTGIPYSIFFEGEYRINVLKKSPDEAWVGLTHHKKPGHSINGFIGNTFYLLAGAIKQIPWKGFPAIMVPVDFKWQESEIFQTDILYSFHMKDPRAVLAWKDAVKGRFEAAWYLAKQGKKSPVRWYFNRIRSAQEQHQESINSYFFFRKDRQTTFSEAEIEIKDHNGKRYLIENTSESSRNQSDLLAGKEAIEIRLTASMNVNKHKRQTPKNPHDKKKKDFFYTFKKTTPYYMTITMNIFDRDADVEEYEHYIDLIRELSQLPLTEVPKFDLRSERRQSDYRKRKFYQRPDDIRSLTHTPVTSIGQFNATASVYLSHHHFLKIRSSPLQKKKKEFQKIFNIKTVLSEKNKEPYHIRIKRILSAPLKLFQIYSPEIDGYQESWKQIDWINTINDKISPLALSEVFENILKGPYPEKISGALIRLASRETVPVKVSFYIKPSGTLDADQKVAIHKLNKTSFQSQIPFPEPEFDQIAKEKLNIFSHAQLKDDRKRAHIKSLDIFNKANNYHTQADDVQIETAIQINQDTPSVKMYIRFETTGNLQLGNYLLGQEVIEISPYSKNNNGENLYRFYLTGEKSPFKGVLFNQLFDFGSKFILSVSVSTDGSVWSDEKTIQLQYQDGVIRILKNHPN